MQRFKIVLSSPVNLGKTLFTGTPAQTLSWLEKNCTFDHEQNCYFYDTDRGPDVVWIVPEEVKE